jgi:hypothetical protein
LDFPEKEKWKPFRLLRIPLLEKEGEKREEEEEARGKEQKKTN